MAVGRQTTAHFTASVWPQEWEPRGLGSLIINIPLHLLENYLQTISYATVIHHTQQMNLSMYGEESTCKPREAGFHCGWDYRGLQVPCAERLQAEELLSRWSQGGRSLRHIHLRLSWTPGPQGCPLLPALRRKHMGWSIRTTHQERLNEK